VLAGVDLVVEGGECVALLGANGAGKTTLVSIAAGLLRPDAGQVDVGGSIGLAPQELGIYPTLSVRENLQFFAELAGFRPAAARREAENIAELLSLTEKISAEADTLSGGQKRRLHAGMALVGSPQLLLLDEPTVGADIETRAKLLEVVRSRAAEGAAVMYSTHYLHEIEQLDAAVAILDGGRVVASGPWRDLVDDCADSIVELKVDGEVSRIATPTPDETAAEMLQAALARGASVERLEIIRPSLETVYLSVVGRRYEGAS